MIVDMLGEESEIWAPLAEYPGYEVSSCGKVKSFWKRGCRPQITEKFRILVPFADGDGRLHVGLRTSNGTIRRKVHQLVLEAFVGPCPEGLECLHKNGDHTCNVLSNLKWGTRLENLEDRKNHGSNARCGQRGMDHRDSKLTDSQVKEIVKLRQDGLGIVKIGEMFGIHSSNVSRIANGKTWKNVTCSS
jgi:hypothetical protein